MNFDLNRHVAIAVLESAGPEPALVGPVLRPRMLRTLSPVPGTRGLGRHTRVESWHKVGLCEQAGEFDLGRAKKDLSQGRLPWERS